MKVVFPKGVIPVNDGIFEIIHDNDPRREFFIKKEGNRRTPALAFRNQVEACSIALNFSKVCIVSETTEWYPGDVKPVHKGWYQREHTTPESLLTGPQYQFNHNPLYYWNGKQWMMPTWDSSIKHLKVSGSSSTQQNRSRWRGVSIEWKDIRGA